MDGEIVSALSVLQEIEVVLSKIGMIMGFGFIAVCVTLASIRPRG